jgi:hypothetical protein
VAIPEPTRTQAIAVVKHFCDNRVPLKHQDQLRIDHVIRGNSITIRELRAPWRDDYGPDWSINPRAQLRYNPQAGSWTLYWPDRNHRWLLYPDAQPTPEIEWLLREIDLDPRGAFWG